MNLTIIGCGAIVESFYLPALNKRQKDIMEIIFVDRNTDRAIYLSKQTTIKSQVVNNYAEIISEVNCAIIATPPGYHFDIAKDLLLRNVTTLVEKPMVEKASDINSLLEIIEKTGSKLMVNNTRRYFPANQAIKEAIDENLIGEIKQIKYHEGGEYNWPTVSGFYFNKESNAKGVLMDRGAHVIDLITWWLNDEIEIISYEDDSLGGPEAFCHAEMKTPNCEIDVKLSWLNKLSNEYRIIGTEGEISGSIYNWKSFTLTQKGKIKVVKVKHKEKLFNDFGNTVFNNFIKLVRGEPDAFTVSAHDVLPSIALIETMYKRRKKIKVPWQDPWVNYAG